MNKETTDTTTHTQPNKSDKHGAQKGKGTAAANNKHYSQTHGDSGKQINTKHTEKKK